MKLNAIRFAVSATALAAAVMCAAPAFAQAPTIKECGANWSAAKAAGTVPAGQTWPQFLSQCRSGTPAPAPTPAAAPAPAPAAPVKPVAAAPAKPAAAAVAGGAVFPTAVSAQYSTLSAGKQRQKTCLDQYNVNKANNGNGGLKWIQSGGGYYSQCNKRLKGA